MKKINMMLLLSMGSVLQGMEQKEIAPLTSDSKTTSQSSPVNVLSLDYFWITTTPYLLYNEGPQVTTKTIKASSCVDQATFPVFRNTHLKDVIINLFERYALNKPFKKEDILNPLFPALFANVQEAKALYANETVAIEAFVATLKSCAQSKDWSPAFAELEVISKEPRLVSQLNTAYWDVNPLVRTTVLSYALLLNAPKELIKSLIDRGASLTNLFPKVVPPLLIMAMKNTDAVALNPAGILGEEVASIIPNEVVDKAYIKEVIMLLCESGAQIQDVFDGSNLGDPYLNRISALEWAILKHDNDLLDYLLSQQKSTPKKSSSLVSPCVLAFRQFLAFRKCTLGPLPPLMTNIQRLANEECCKVLLQYSKNNILEVFSACTYVITGTQRIPGLSVYQAAGIAVGVTSALSLFIEYGVDVNHLIEKKTILDRAEDEGWHTAIINFLIEKGAHKSPVELTQEEIKALTLRKVLEDMTIESITGQPIEKEKMRGFFKDALEITKNGSIDWMRNSNGDSFNHACALAIGLGSSLAFDEALDFLTCLESHNLFSSDSPSYGTISSVFHKIVSWLHDVKRACPNENAFNEVVKRESLRSLIVNLAQKGVKDKPNSEGKTAAQKAYELGFEEIAHLITNAINKS